MGLEQEAPQKQRRSWVEANPVVANFAASGVSVATGAAEQGCGACCQVLLPGCNTITCGLTVRHYWPAEPLLFVRQIQHDRASGNRHLYGGATVPSAPHTRPGLRQAWC